MQEILVKLAFFVNFICHSYLLYKSLLINDIMDFIILFLTEFGLVFDNFIILFGFYILPTNLFQKTSFLRYFMHGTITPLLFLVFTKLHQSFYQNKFWFYSFEFIFISIITFVFSTYGLFHYFKIELEQKTQHGIVTFKSKKMDKLSLVPVISLIVYGIYIGYVDYSLNSSSYLFLGCIIMFFLSSIQNSYRDVISNIGEVIFMGCLIFTLIK
jgi:hypothetical protein